MRSDISTVPYVGKKLPEYVRNEVCEKGYRNNPLIDERQKTIGRKSNTCYRIERVFAFEIMSMHGLTVHSIGLECATFNIGLTTLVDILCRYTYLSQQETAIG